MHMADSHVMEGSQKWFIRGALVENYVYFSVKYLTRAFTLENHTEEIRKTLVE
jgi:hypothetical protein